MPSAPQQIMSIQAAKDTYSASAAGTPSRNPAFYSSQPARPASQSTASRTYKAATGREDSLSRRRRALWTLCRSLILGMPHCPPPLSLHNQQRRYRELMRDSQLQPPRSPRVQRLHDPDRETHHRGGKHRRLRAGVEQKSRRKPKPEEKAGCALSLHTDPRESERDCAACVFCPFPIISRLLGIPDITGGHLYVQRDNRSGQPSLPSPSHTSLQIHGVEGAGSVYEVSNWSKIFGIAWCGLIFSLCFLLLSSSSRGGCCCPFTAKSSIMRQKRLLCCHEKSPVQVILVLFGVHSTARHPQV